MDEWAKIQSGSPSRDQFKLRHKELHRSLYACDLDFVLVQNVPTPDIIAAIDYKQREDRISFSEVIAYNALIRRGIRMFIVSGDAETGVFEIEEYIGGHHRKPTSSLRKVCAVDSWQSFERWELSLRNEYMERFGE